MKILHPHVFFKLIFSIVIISSGLVAEARYVKNGSYVGSYLVCNNGYVDVGGACKKLPPVKNGSYVGSYLVCNNGYVDVGGGCKKLPPVFVKESVT